MTGPDPGAAPPFEHEERLTVLAVDDEAPALDELDYLLRRNPLVGDVVAVGDATEALRCLHVRDFDAVLLDVRMPGLDGLELARVLERFATPPAVIFVTAHEEYALAAFEVEAVDYLLKPVDELRLSAALQRVPAARRHADTHDTWEIIAVERAGRTLLVARSEVEWVESAGDYVRLHTAEAAHLVRIPMGALHQRWAAHGFTRIHRSYLVALRAVRELRSDGSQTVVVVGRHELPVSRRHLRELRETLMRHAGRSRR